MRAEGELASRRILYKCTCTRYSVLRVDLLYMYPEATHVILLYMYRIGVYCISGTFDHVVDETGVLTHDPRPMNSTTQATTQENGSNFST